MQIGELFEVVRDIRIQDRHLLHFALITNLRELARGLPFSALIQIIPYSATTPYTLGAAAPDLRILALRSEKRMSETLVTGL